MGMRGQRHAPDALPSAKIPGTHLQEAGWAQGQFKQVWKISPPPGFNPQTVQPVATRYTD
jgi:hypothetical protein